jgi:hypothetical protein
VEEPGDVLGQLVAVGGEEPLVTLLLAHPTIQGPEGIFTPPPPKKTNRNPCPRLYLQFISLGLE